MSFDYKRTALLSQHDRSSGHRLAMALRVYGWVGLLAGLYGGAYFVLLLLTKERTYAQTMAFTFCVVGLTLAIICGALVTLRTAQKASRNDQLRYGLNLRFFLEAWARFEQASADTLQGLGEPMAAYSPRRAVERLQAQGRVSDADIALILEALGVRNTIVSGEHSLSADVMAEMTKALDGIVGKISLTDADRSFADEPIQYKFN